MKKLVVGNWKMNPGTLDEAKKIARKVRRTAAELRRTEAVVCPPFPFIEPCLPSKPVKNFHVGAQSVSTEEGTGPDTGEVSGAMLRDIGVEYVIVGHSEERNRGDTDAVVAKRLKAVLDADLTAIVCVGESARDEQGQYLETLRRQIKTSLAEAPKSRAADIIIAYEPVWAIGAKEPMSPADIGETSIFVRKVLAEAFTPEAGMRATVLYGGAVNFRNAPDIVKIGRVDGLLVGRESVNTAGFVELLKAVDAVDA